MIIKIKNILEHYEVGNLISFETLTNGLENINILLRTTKGKYVLRIYQESPNKTKSKEYVYFEVDLLKHLHKHKLQTPQIIPSKQNVVLELENELIVLFKFIEGSIPRKKNIKLIAEISSFVTKFHSCTKQFSSKYTKFRLPKTPKLVRDTLLKNLENYPYNHIKKDILEKSTCLQKMNFENLPKGIIHMDLHQWNMLSKKNKLVAILDFDDSFHGPLLFDLGSIIMFNCHTENGYNKEYINILLTEYTKERQLTTEEKTKLPEVISFCIFNMLSHLVNLKNSLDMKQYVEAALLQLEDLNNLDIFN